MRQKYLRILLLALILIRHESILSVHLAASAVDEKLETFEEFIPGKFNVSARLRYEVFDAGSGLLAGPDFGPKDRDGMSLRLRYGYTTEDFKGFSGMIEGETVTRLGGKSVDIHPLDNRGDGTDLNQFWIQYKNEAYGSIRAGRQIYFLDDHRFIGNVVWRQNIQTFDATTFNYTPIDELSIKGFYFIEQNTVFGEHNELNAYGLNVSYDLVENSKLTVFYYNIEGDDTGNASISSKTGGLRITGSFSLSEQDFNYSASIAEQEESNPSPLDYNAGYLAADLSTIVFNTTIGGGFEILDPEFRTPLSTVHKFNGFADALLPLAGFTNGLEDFYIYAGYKIPVGNGIVFKSIYHWFDSNSKGLAGENGGQELDLIASYEINQYFSVLGKYGDYNTEGGVGNAGAADKKMFTFELDFVY